MGAAVKLTICTGWSPTGYHEYGRRFAESFARHWPESVELVVYGEEPVELPRGTFRRLSEIPGCAEWLAAHDSWQFRGHRDGPDYKWRLDAWKFSRQGFIPADAAARLPDSGAPQFLAWLDGDVITHRNVPEGWPQLLLPPGYDVAYLGRPPKHSEIGFQLYRLNGPASPALRLLGLFRELYTSGEVFRLREWHSAFVWDEARVRSGARAFNLTPNGHGHVWHQSPLARYTDHLKGKRKAYGRSPERRQ